MPTVRPRVFSGIQPTGGGFHLGNYLGAVRNWVAMQDDHDALFCVVDLHAITVGHDPATLRRRTYESVAELLALGIDPDRCTLFVQSHVAEHAELAWVLGCVTGFGEASRMIQFKDKSQRQGGDAASVGLFTYPVLMAADILLHRANAVPVGEDQRQHLELTRTLAHRFNRSYGPTFPVPEAYIPPSTGKILDLANPAKQMSKTVGGAGVVYLQDQPAVVRRKIRSAVTDTGREVRAGPDKPGVTNLLTILSALSGRPVPALELDYAGRGYGELKADVAESVVEALAPVQQRYRLLLDDPAELDMVLGRGAERARCTAAPTMADVRERVGFVAADG